MHDITQFTVLARTYICAAELATWAVGPDVWKYRLIYPQVYTVASITA